MGDDAFFAFFFEAEGEFEFVRTFETAEVAAVELGEGYYDEIFFVKCEGELGFVVSNLPGDGDTDPLLGADPACADQADTVEDFELAEKIVDWHCQ